MQIWTWHKKSKEKGCLCQRKGSGQPKTLEESVDRVHKNLARPKEMFTKNKPGNPDSTNNSLAHPEETLDNDTLQGTLAQAIMAEDKQKRKPN